MPALNATKTGFSALSFTGKTAGTIRISKAQRSGKQRIGRVVSKPLAGQNASNLGQPPKGCNGKPLNSNRPSDGTNDYVTNPLGSKEKKQEAQQ